MNGGNLTPSFPSIPKEQIDSIGALKGDKNDDNSVPQANNRLRNNPTQANSRSDKRGKRAALLNNSRFDPNSFLPYDNNSAFYRNATALPSEPSASHEDAENCVNSCVLDVARPDNPSSIGAWAGRKQQQQQQQQQQRRQRNEAKAQAKLEQREQRKQRARLDPNTQQSDNLAEGEKVNHPNGGKKAYQNSAKNKSKQKVDPENLDMAIASPDNDSKPEEESGNHDNPEQQHNQKPKQRDNNKKNRNKKNKLTISTTIPSLWSQKHNWTPHQLNATAAGLMHVIVTDDDVYCLFIAERRTENSLFLTPPGGKTNRWETSTWQSACREYGEENSHFFHSLGFNLCDQSDLLSCGIGVARNERSRYILHILEMDHDTAFTPLEELYQSKKYWFKNGQKGKKIAAVTNDPEQNPKNTLKMSDLYPLLQPESKFYEYYSPNQSNFPIVGQISNPRCQVNLSPYPSYPYTHLTTKQQMAKIPVSFASLPLHYDYFCHKGLPPSPIPIIGAQSTRDQQFSVQPTTNSPIPWHLQFEPGSTKPRVIHQNEIQVEGIGDGEEQKLVNDVSEDHVGDYSDYIGVDNDNHHDGINTKIKTAPGYILPFLSDSKTTYSSHICGPDHAVSYQWVSLKSLLITEKTFKLIPEQEWSDQLKITKSRPDLAIPIDDLSRDSLFFHFDREDYQYEYHPSYNQDIWQKHHHNFLKTSSGPDLPSERKWTNKESALLDGYLPIVAPDGTRKRPDNGMIIVVKTVSGLEFPLSPLSTRCLCSHGGILDRYGPLVHKLNQGSPPTKKED